MPQVSVIIPTHSRPHLLSRAVESAQSAGSDVEVIVVDDASNDETAEVCRNLADIKYIRLDVNQLHRSSNSITRARQTVPTKTARGEKVVSAPNHHG